jgi:hypothetical protein
MEHRSIGQALNLGDQPLALRFADSHPCLTDEIGATTQNQKALLRGEEVTQERDVARVECEGRGLYRATAEDLAVKLHQPGR